MLSFSARKILIFAFLLFLFAPIFSETAPSDDAEPLSDSSDSADSNIDSDSSASSESKKIKFNPIIFASDILNDKYPVRVDFGAEPHRHGSMLFVAADYDWSESFSQRIRFEYDHYSTSTDSSDSLSTQGVRSITIMPFPIVFFFGDSDYTAQTRFTRLNIGLYYSYTHSKTNTGSFFNLGNDEEWGDYAGKSGFAISDTNQKYHLIGPAIGYSVNFPLYKTYVSATIEGFFVPAFLVTLETETTTSFYFDDDSVSTNDSLSFRSLSFPIAQQTLSLDMFRYLRIKAQISYQHLDLRALTGGNDSIRNYSLHTLTLRYGGELLKPKKTRKKSAHLWAGLYYEMTWNKAYIQEVSFTTYEGKWVLCFGT